LSEKEEYDPFVLIGCVVKLRSSDWGRLEQFAEGKLRAEFLHVKKTRVGSYLKIIEIKEDEYNGRNRNDRNGFNR